MGIDPVNSPGYNPTPGNDKPMWGAGPAPTVKPLPADDPWCKFFHKLFPNCPESGVAEGAAILKNNMFQMVQEAINHATKKAKEASDRLKKVARGDE